MSEWAVQVLKDYGLAGVVIAALAIAVVVLYRAKERESAGRLKDAERLHQVANSTIAALNQVTSASTESVELVEELAEVSEKQSAAFVRMTDRFEFLIGGVREELARHGLVISAVSQATQVQTGVVTDLRNEVTALKADLKSRGRRS